MSVVPSIPTPLTQPALDMRVRDLGRMNYADALALQRQLQLEVIESRTSDASGTTGLAHLLLVEHDPPVITVSRRPDARKHLIASEQLLLAAGVEVAETDRGGDITYHGPGQLVVYPILDLNRFGLRIDSYMRMLEQIVIDVLARFGIAGERDSAATGVWVRSNAAPSKICAMGVRVSRWVSMHGLALNVATNLDHFSLIVPCGLAGRSVTSMQRELGASAPMMEAVKQAMIDAFTQTLRAR
ncbi:MAG TPA: lipoyl(octanoyl) transferase LipB [Phycisphaerales bacterium]|nr:lipoyl(octanoyl) transferase LipB [Phycisphaerales bacterium]